MRSSLLIFVFLTGCAWSFGNDRTQDHASAACAAVVHLSAKEVSATVALDALERLREAGLGAADTQTSSPVAIGRTLARWTETPVLRWVSQAVRATASARLAKVKKALSGLHPGQTLLFSGRDEIESGFLNPLRTLNGKLDDLDRAQGSHVLESALLGLGVAGGYVALEVSGAMGSPQGSVATLGSAVAVGVSAASLSAVWNSLRGWVDLKRFLRGATWAVKQSALTEPLYYGVTVHPRRQLADWKSGASTASRSIDIALFWDAQDRKWCLLVHTGSEHIQ
jgi:hypothetical protein